MTCIRSGALWYAARGLHVFPCAQGAKTPVTEHGCRDATIDRAQIDRWWREYPYANIGVCAGPSQLVIVDVDGDDGVDALRDGDTPRTWTARTRRGWHLYYRAPHGVAPGPRAGVLPSVDVRAGWSYVIAPPSAHPSGYQYRWATGRRPNDLSLAAAPTWLVELLHRPEPPAESRPIDPGDISSYARAALDRECQTVASTAPGSRNHTLNAAAFSLGTLVGAGALDGETVAAALGDAARKAGLQTREIRRTVASGLRAGIEQPRRVAS